MSQKYDVSNADISKGEKNDPTCEFRKKVDPNKKPQRYFYGIPEEEYIENMKKKQEDAQDLTQTGPSME